MPAMMAFWDRDQRCVFANRAYERWFGVTPEWLVGRTLAELLGPIYPLNLPYIEGALRGEPQQFERSIPDPSGGPVRHSLANYLPKVENGVTVGFHVLVTDVTQLKHTQEALRQAQLDAEAALADVKRLAELLPVCAWCGKVRDDDGYWRNVYQYLQSRINLTVTHGICADCERTHFPDRPGPE
jgi:PAS domain S-box-containing protein